MKPFTVPGLLRAAAAYIEIHGHEQRPWMGGGRNYASGQPCCPLVAFGRLTNINAYGLRLAAKGAIKSAIFIDVGTWSDRTPTAEVLATMRRVARELDAR